MVEKARRSPVDGDDYGNPTPQWEVFVRDDEGAPMKYVGSVAAESATEAHEHASRLFGWYAVDVWLCPADSVERFSTRGLESNDDEGDSDAERTAESDGNDGTADGERSHESDGNDNVGDEGDETNRDEPRVYEETEGTPRVRDT